MGNQLHIDVSKRDKGYSLEVAPAEPGTGVHQCDDFGDVLSHILYYHGQSPNTQMIMGRRNKDYLTDSQMEDLEGLMDMHNQLSEIQETFKARERE